MMSRKISAVSWLRWSSNYSNR